MSLGEYNETINYLDLCPDLDPGQDFDNLFMYEVWSNDCQLSSVINSERFLTEEQRLVCDILSRAASILSMAGSCYIIYCLLGPKREMELKKRVFSRLLLGLSVSDTLSSLAMAMGHWPKPSDDPYIDNYSDGSFLIRSIGNQATCNVQGLFIQTFYYASLYYTACLSLNFLYTVNYRWTESQLKAKLEPWFHGVSVLLPLVLALLAYFFEMYNPVSLSCGLGTSPQGCDNEDDLECARGSHVFFWWLALRFLPSVGSFLTILVSMVRIYRAVRAQEESIAKFSMRDASEIWASPADTTSPQEETGGLPSSIQSPRKPAPPSAKAIQRQKQRFKDSRLAFSKAALYIGISVAVWLPAFVVAVCKTGGDHIPFALWIVRSIMTPIVGLLNALAYSGTLSSSLVPKLGLSSVLSFVSARRFGTPPSNNLKQSKEEIISSTDHTEL